MKGIPEGHENDSGIVRTLGAERGMRIGKRDGLFTNRQVSGLKFQSEKKAREREAGDKVPE